MKRTSQQQLLKAATTLVKARYYPLDVKLDHVEITDEHWGLKKLNIHFGEVLIYSFTDTTNTGLLNQILERTVKLFDFESET